MNADFFLDTNLIVYLFDTSEPTKRQKVKQLLAQYQPGKHGYISAQVVNEFIVIATRKITNPIPLDVIHQHIMYLQQQLHVSSLHTRTSLKAIEIKRRYQYSFWDSLIIASALENNCTLLYSEDMQHGQVIDGTLTIQNPLKP
jgi:predicted nucleic acid-binding protein